MSIENCSTDDLVNRWSHLFDDYKEKLISLDKLLLDISKTRNELYMIREELSNRSIDVDEVDGEKGD